MYTDAVVPTESKIVEESYLKNLTQLPFHFKVITLSVMVVMHRVNLGPV